MLGLVQVGPNCYRKGLRSVAGGRVPCSRDLGRRQETPGHFSSPAERDVAEATCFLEVALYNIDEHDSGTDKLKLLGSTLHRYNHRKLHLKLLENGQGAFNAIRRLLPNNKIQPWRRLRAMQSCLHPVALWGVAAAGVSISVAHD